LIVRTPLRRSEWLTNAAGTDIFLKIETLQPTFSYKIRGAFNAALCVREEHGQDAPPLVTASAGNHGRALALAARETGLSLTVYVPEAAPRVKVDAIRSLGAELIACRDYDEAESRARDHGQTGAALFISPYSHPDVIAGAATIGLEIMEERPDVQEIVVPVGGGGLVSGIAIAATAFAHRPNIVGVEVEASSPFTHGLAAHRVVPIEVRPTLADGLAGNLDPNTITFDIVSRMVDEIVVVSEPQLEKAIGDLFREERLVVEGAGSVAVAAVVQRAARRSGRATAVVVSGANIDAATLKRFI
jgi:threonine dehydratase